ncbi:HAD-IIB family hydrolase [Reinekea thalattae]|uniref:HAD-IIB family hydrolase n=1 Tax=Reinekea thalattae TaxID=2593301 RepID=UPI0016503F25|nr:HAD-IIB family hydrolase [Reinekea thalattae]
MNELLVFDLDGTLLNEHEQLSPVTQKALDQLDRLGINWTVATGRMPHGAREALPNLVFKHPQAYKNGVLLWDLNEDTVFSKIPMSQQDAIEVCQRLYAKDIKPWVNTIDHEDNIGAVITGITSDKEKQWSDYLSSQGIRVQQQSDYSTLPEHVLNIFAATNNPAVLDMSEELAHLDGVAVFAGPDMYHAGGYWLDIHHSSGTKGDAVQLIKKQLGADKTICFGDSDNDISMFELADECYAMGQGLDELKAIATATIGSNSEDGIAHFLAQRYGFDL